MWADAYSMGVTDYKPWKSTLGDAQVAFWGTKDTNKKKNQTLTPTHTQQHTRYLLKIRGGQGYSEKLKVLWD